MARNLSWDPWQKRTSVIGPACPHFTVSKEILWTHGLYNPSWVAQELTQRAQHEQDNEKNAAISFIALLRACSKNKDLRNGALVHDDILRRGLLENCLDSLITMYAKCGALAKAEELFDMHTSMNVVTWTALIAGLAQKGRGHDALNYFDRMRHKGLPPDVVTFTCILKACASIGALDKGIQIHNEIAKQGLLRNNILLGNALMNMYAKCGALAKARRVLDELPIRNVTSWSTLIAGYSHHGEGEQALDCFERMQHEGFSPDAATFTCILKACSTIRAADKGENIHDEIAKQGMLENDIVLASALVDMYAKCGALAKARQVLEELPVRDVVSWSALIAGYVENGEGEQALNCFKKMQSERLSPDAVTFSCILRACGIIGAADKGEKIHDEIAKQGLLGNNVVLGTALVDMYAKCNALAKARRALEALPVRNAISWNALIAGYVEHDECVQALDCFEAMQCEGVSPDEVTFICILKACGSIRAANKGEKLHDEMVKQGLLRNDMVLGTALVDMYAKCGALAKARQVLEELPVRDVISWNAIIAGAAQQGDGEQALTCFDQMQCEGVSPDATTFLCILSACGRLCRAEDAQEYFVNMSINHGVDPDVEHYTCMADLFGRAGHLEKAVEVIERMPSSDSGVWSALLGSCQKWGNVNVGRWAFEHSMQAG